MRIIKQGNIAEPLPTLAVCVRCGTEFEFLPTEAEYVACMYEESYTIKCPVCGRTVTAATATERKPWSER